MIIKYTCCQHDELTTKSTDFILVHAHVKILFYIFKIIHLKLFLNYNAEHCDYHHIAPT